MAGSINLSLSQQFDIMNGKLLSGGRLYFYSAGTTTPQNVYQDQALTIAYPNPIILGSDGRVPAFYVADGSVRVRLTNKNGVKQFDTDNILVVGPSSGGGGGSSVDATTIFQTGDVMWLDVSGTRSGWVRDNGRTIGSATSGSAERANADCQSLFEFLWNTYSDTIAPVVTGRGASSAADWASNKQITLPDKRGCDPRGLDTMGNSAANKFTGVPFVSGDSVTAGSICGEPTHALTIAELPAVDIDDYRSTNGTASMGYQTNAFALGGITGVTAVDSSGTVNKTLPLTAPTYAAFGGNTAHNNTPRGVLGTFYRKL